MSQVASKIIPTIAKRAAKNSTSCLYERARSVALGRRGGKAKNAKLTEEERKAVMEEVRASRWPPKLHTVKTLCPKPGCKVTVNREHIGE